MMSVLCDSAESNNVVICNAVFSLRSSSHFKRSRHLLRKVLVAENLCWRVMKREGCDAEKIYFRIRVCICSLGVTISVQLIKFADMVLLVQRYCPSSNEHIPF